MERELREKVDKKLRCAVVLLGVFGDDRKFRNWREWQNGVIRMFLRKTW